MWYLKQLFPFRYITTFRRNNQWWLCIWRMFLGRCFDIRYFRLESPEEYNQAEFNTLMELCDEDNKSSEAGPM